jgi:diguanylate cyclase (GGDEF)-like protein/PAS domain S-box-containing protein
LDHAGHINDGGEISAPSITSKPQVQNKRSRLCVEKDVPAVSRFLKSPLTVVTLLLCLTLASLWGFVIWKAEQERANAFAKAATATQSLTHSLAQHASKSFGAAALAILGAAQYIQHSDRSAKASAEINDFLAQYAKGIPEVRELGVLSEKGGWIFSSYETVPPVSNADRPYFVYHRDNADPAIRINGPLLSRATGRQTVLMTQRLSHTDGTFAGIVFAAIDLEHFRAFYRTFEADQRRTVTLMTRDGKVLAHREPGEVGKDLTHTSLFARHLKNAPTGLYKIISPFDGREKQFAYERLSDFPIVVSVAAAEDDILNAWRSDRRIDFLLAAAISVVLIILAVVLIVQFRGRSAMARTLRESERGYRLLAENVEDIVTRVDTKGNRLYISPSIEKLLGWTASEIIVQSAYSNIHPAHREIVKRLLEGLSADNRSATGEYMSRHKDGNYVWVEARFTYVPNPQDGSPEIVAVIRDISKRKVAEEQMWMANDQLKALSETDTLTGIANRRKFDEAFERELRRSQRAGSHLALLLVDIDRFKLFNDSYGHSAGDDCLRHVAHALAAHLKRPADLVARYGGEEFAVILPDMALDGAGRLAEDLRQAISDLGIAHALNGGGVVTVSIGVAGARCDREISGKSLLEAADAALYRAKNEGRNRVCVSGDRSIATRTGTVG